MALLSLTSRIILPDINWSRRNVYRKVEQMTM